MVEGEEKAGPEIKTFNEIELPRNVTTFFSSSSGSTPLPNSGLDSQIGRQRALMSGNLVANCLPMLRRTGNTASQATVTHKTVST